MNNLEKYNIEKETLTIKGLKHNYRIMQISDSHMCFDSELDDEATREKARKMTDIWTSVGNTFSQIENYDKMLLIGKENNCDMFVFAGDIVDFPSKGNLVGLKKKLLESENFIFTLGNHERSAQFDSDFAELMCGSTMIHTKELGDYCLFPSTMLLIAFRPKRYPSFVRYSAESVPLYSCITYRFQLPNCTTMRCGS